MENDFREFYERRCIGKKLNFRLNDILNIFYQLKKEYGEISYYWLQMGIAEQRRQDYVKALNHLHMAETIRPHAYQIQHAIARNYLKQSNHTKNFEEAKILFKIGEEKMFKLINSHEGYKSKAKKFSIHCYVIEKIRYIKKFSKVINNEDIRRIKRQIDSILDIRDEYIDKLLVEFVDFLKFYDKLDVINFQPGDRYWNVLNKQKILAVDESEDILIESY